jgi:murein L,D-transpeptidase YafK
LAKHKTTRRRLDRRRPGISAVALLVLLFTTSALSDAAVHADRIVVLKAKRTMLLYRGDKIIKTYRVALGGNPIGPKARQGDHKTPEGIYRIDAKNSKSQFHVSLHVSYPSEKDQANAKKLGLSPGADIMIHGLPDKYAYLGLMQSHYDWTDGCIAVSNAEIEEIWKFVPVGTPVEIRP